MGSISDPTNAGNATRDVSNSSSPVDAAAVGSPSDPRTVGVVPSPTPDGAEHNEGTPVTAASAIPDASAPTVQTPPTDAEHAGDADGATTVSTAVLVADVKAVDEDGGESSAPVVTASAPAPPATVPTVATSPEPASDAPASVMSEPVPMPTEGVGRPAERQVTGPGGGKRRKPGQVNVSIAPEWVPVPSAPRQASFLGGPAIWGVIAIVAVLLAGTVLSNGAFTPFAVDTVDVATNTLTSDTVPIAPGRVQTTSMTLGDLTPGTTVVRAPFSVKADAPGTGKPIAAYVSLVSEKPAPYVRAVIFRCLDNGGAPAPCDTAVGFSDAHLDTGGTTPIMIETTGGPPASATVRSTSGGDLEVLDGAGNVKKGGRVRGVAPVARPAQGASAKLSDFFVVGGTTGGLGHGAQDVGVNGATATLPMVKGIPGLPPGGQAYLLAYLYAPSDTPVADAAAKVAVTVAVLAISADATP